MKSKLDKLNELGELLKSGTITQEEFNMLKAELLNPPSQPKENPKLIELNELLESGVITQEEFNNLKNELLNLKKQSEENPNLIELDKSKATTIKKETTNSNQKAILESRTNTVPSGIERKFSSNEKQISKGRVKVKSSSKVNKYLPFVGVIFLFIFFKTCDFGSDSPKTNLNLQNDSEVNNYIQGKWTGNFYTTYGGKNRKWDVRFLISGNKISSWVREAESYDKYAKNWSEVSPKLENETIGIVNVNSKTGKATLTVDDKYLEQSFTLYNNGAFIYGRHTLNRGWKD